MGRGRTRRGVIGDKADGDSAVASARAFTAANAAAGSICMGAELLVLPAGSGGTSRPGEGMTEGGRVGKGGTVVKDRD